MNKLKLLLLAGLLLVVGSATAAKQTKHTFTIANGNFLYDGKPTQIHSGELHYARVPAPYWRHRLQMMKAMGLNAVTSYVFWNHHETSPGVWDWQTGNHNIRNFIKIAGEEGLMVILRPGPYCCAGLSMVAAQSQRFDYSHRQQTLLRFLSCVHQSAG